MKTPRFKARPDELDVGIVEFVCDTPGPVTIPDIHRRVCPERPVNTVRYRVASLHRAGFLREMRVLGRVIVLPAPAEAQDGVVANV